MTVLPKPARRAILTVQGIALAGVLTLASMAGAGAAQDATPASADASCVPATTASTMATMEAATPIADLQATPASDDITTRATEAVENFAACWNSGDLGATLGLVTPNLLQTSFGVADAQAAEAALPELDLGSIVILEVGDASTYADGRASIDVGYSRGNYQHVDARWFMVERDGQLLIDQEQLLPPDVEGDKAFISFSVADDASPVGFDQRSEITPIEVVVLHGVNNGESLRVFTVHALPPMEGTPMPGEMPEGGETIGIVAIAPGEQEDLPLVGLEPGVYALADSSVEGSVATLVIAESEE